jgi:thioester reductase-like protein
MRRGYDEVVLVTGYPSFGARHMVAEILATEPKTMVYAVVRDKLAEAATAHLATLPEEQRSRVVVLEGDAAHMDLGLSGAELRQLASEVDRIHHCAQVSYQGVDRAAAEQVNVGATREILELARACTGLQALIHHSTAFVSGDRTGLVREDELERDQRFRNVVEETKARAEKLVRASKLPTVIVRPTTLVGDSQTGEVERLDGPYLLVLLILTSPQEIAIPLPGRGDAPLHLVPVDWATRAAHRIGRDPRAIGKTFHLVDPAPLTSKQVFDLVARAGGKRSPRGFIPVNLTRALLATPGLERFAKSPRAFLDQLVTPVRYDARNTEALLPDLPCPPFSSYVDAMVSYVRRRVDERRAETPMVELEVDDAL